MKIKLILIYIILNIIYCNAFRVDDHPVRRYFDRQQQRFGQDTTQNILSEWPGRNYGEDGPGKNGGYYDAHDHVTGVLSPQCTALAWLFEVRDADIHLIYNPKYAAGQITAVKNAQIKLKNDWQNTLKSYYSVEEVQSWDDIHNWLKSFPSGDPDWAEPLVDENEQIAMYLCEWVSFRTMRGWPIRTIERIVTGSDPKDSPRYDRMKQFFSSKDGMWDTVHRLYSNLLNNALNPFIQELIKINHNSGMPTWIDDQLRAMYGSETVPALYECIINANDPIDLNNAIVNTFTASRVIDYDAAYIAQDPLAKPVAHLRFSGLGFQQHIITGRITYMQMFQPMEKLPVRKEDMNEVLKLITTAPITGDKLKGRLLIADGLYWNYLQMSEPTFGIDKEGKRAYDLEVLPHASQLEFAESEDGKYCEIQHQGPFASGGNVQSMDTHFDRKPAKFGCHDSRFFQAAPGFLALDHVRGIDFATNEIAHMTNYDSTKPKFTDTMDKIKASKGGKANIRKWMRLVYDAAKKKGKRLVLHIHCGEGFPVFNKHNYNNGEFGVQQPIWPSKDDYPKKSQHELQKLRNQDFFAKPSLQEFCKNAYKQYEKVTPIKTFKDFHPTWSSQPLGRHYGNGQRNIEVLAQNIIDIKTEMGAKIKKEFEDFVEIRFGHITHLSPKGAKLMVQGGITGDVNLMSNIATGALDYDQLPNQDRQHMNKIHLLPSDELARIWRYHGVVSALAGDVCACQGSDGRGIEWSNHRHEAGIIDAIIKEFNNPSSNFRKNKNVNGIYSAFSNMRQKGVDDVLKECKTQVEWIKGTPGDGKKPCTVPKPKKPKRKTASTTTQQISKPKRKKQRTGPKPKRERQTAQDKRLVQQGQKVKDRRKQTGTTTMSGKQKKKLLQAKRAEKRLARNKKY